MKLDTATLSPVTKILMIGDATNLSDYTATTYRIADAGHSSSLLQIDSAASIGQRRRHAAGLRDQRIHERRHRLARGCDEAHRVARFRCHDTDGAQGGALGQAERRSEPSRHHARPAPGAHM